MSRQARQYVRYGSKHASGERARGRRGAAIGSAAPKSVADPPKERDTTGRLAASEGKGSKAMQPTNLSRPHAASPPSTPRLCDCERAHGAGREREQAGGGPGLAARTRDQSTLPACAARSAGRTDGRARPVARLTGDAGLLAVSS